MALTYYVEVSAGTETALPSVADGAFVALGDPITGSSFDLFQTPESTPPVVPGALYAYRVRVFDDTTGLFSDYSALAFARAPYPYSENTMDTVLDPTITGAEVEIGIGLEQFYGIPVVAQKKLEVRNWDPANSITTIYGQSLRNAATERRKTAAGPAKYGGAFDVELTPEGGTLILLQGWMPLTTTGTGPYVHTFSNKFGAKSFTLIVRIGTLMFVYPGSRITQIQFDNLTAGSATRDIVLAKITVDSLREIMYDLTANSGAYALYDMDVAAADTLGPWSGANAISYLANKAGTFKGMTFSANSKLGSKEVCNGTRSCAAYFQTSRTVDAGATVYFEDLGNHLREAGYASSTTTDVARGLTSSVVLAPVSFVFTPPANGSGVVNTLAFNWSDCNVTQKINVKDRTEVDQTLSMQAVDAPGNSLGTDFTLAITNSVTNATAITCGAPVANIPKDAASNLFTAALTGTPSTTVMGADAVNSASFSTLDNDPFYLSKNVLMLTGTLAGQFRPISAYTATSRTFTVSTAFSSAPASGDLFTVA